MTENAICLNVWGTSIYFLFLKKSGCLLSIVPSL